MQQRQPRLGDILDDYCPRERRITNHAVVAMIGQDIKQTRCTTCEAEHDYRHGKVPPQRNKKESSSGLYKQVLTGLSKKEGTPALASASAPAPVEPEPSNDLPIDPAIDQNPSVSAHPEVTEDDEGPVHRPLIRATLPRPEGQAPTRPLPEFTLRQPAGRPGRFRPTGGPLGNRPPNYSQPPGGNSTRPHGMRHGPPGRPGDRSGPQSSRTGGRPPHPHRSSRHPMNAARPGKKRHK